MDEISEEEAICKLQNIIDSESDDEEAAHSKADDVLRDFINGLGYEEIALLYDAIPKWCA